MRRSPRRVVLTATLPVLIGLSACSSSGGSARDTLMMQPVPSAAVVSSLNVPGLGTVLVDGAGHTLYEFPPDAQQQVTCTGPCAGIWPPLTIADGRTPTASGQARSGELSTIADPGADARVVTYNGFPLYRYSGDLSAGQANGQALFNSKGPWYVMNTAGQPIVAGGAS